MNKNMIKEVAAMKSLEVKEAQAAKSTKEQTLEELRKLEAIIKRLQTKVGVLEREATDLREQSAKEKSKIIDQCWWDGDRCSRYSAISGFQDVDGRCLAGCPRLDKPRLLYIFDLVFGAEINSENSQVVEEASKEAEEEAWEEIAEKVAEIFLEVEGEEGEEEEKAAK